MEVLRRLGLGGVSRKDQAPLAPPRSLANTLSAGLLCTRHALTQGEGVAGWPRKGSWQTAERQALRLFALSTARPPVSPGSVSPTPPFPCSLAGLWRVFQSAGQGLLPENGQASFFLVDGGWSFKVHLNPCFLLGPKQVLLEL